MKIALMQIGAGDTLDSALDRGLSACRRAKGLGADLALFPEMFSNGYRIYGRPPSQWMGEAIPAGHRFVRSFEELAKELEKSTWKSLAIPYVTNVTAQEVTDISETPELLARQVSAPVKWEQSMETMIESGVDTFVEIGPGKTLTGFLKKIAPEKKVLQVGAWEDIEKVMQELKQ